MRYDDLVDALLFRGIMFAGAALIFWYAFVVIPRERLRQRREEKEYDLESALSRHWGDIAQVAASARTGFPLIIGFIVTAIQMLVMAFMGSDLRFDDWRYWLQALAVVGVWVLLARELGWPNLLVSRELRGVPGLLFVRIRRHRAGIPSDDSISGGATEPERSSGGEKPPGRGAGAGE